jgi:acid phosphatase family membrane protein YuiD
MTYQFLLVPLIALFISQLIKLMTSEEKVEKRNWLRTLTHYGGMPSSHAAFVSSLTTLIGLSTGIFSIPFSLSFVFSLLVLRDALGLRQELSKQAEILNLLIKKLPEEERTQYPLLNTNLGHRWQEILIGCCLGISLSLFFYFSLG